MALAYWFFGSIAFAFIVKLLRSEYHQKVIAADELAQHKRYLDNLIGNAPEGIVWADKHSNIKYVNQKFTQIFGYTNEEARGKNVDKLLNDPDQTGEAEKITIAVAQGIPQEAEGIRKRKDGSLVHVSIVGAPMESMEGKLEVFGIYRDISEEKLAEENLIASEKSLRELSTQLMSANNFKELLLDIITHDLRNPSGVISGALEILEDEFPDNEIVDLIKKSSDNLVQVIEDAGTLSKLSMGESIQLEEMDIVPILLGVADTFASQLHSVNMELSIDLPDAIVVPTNRIIGEVFSNYISNAIKYASEGHKIELSAEDNSKYALVELRDFGKTIPEDKRSGIFDRSVQLLDGPRKGSGLGLAIVKRIAIAQGAEVGVHENQPQGNVFYFKFIKTSTDG